MKKLIQISFDGSADLDIVEKHLKEVSKEDADFICCFLNKRMVEERGIDPSAVDLLDRILGDRLTWIADRYKNFNSFVKDLEYVRRVAENKSDKLYVLASDMSKGVAREIQLKSNNKVFIFNVNEETIKTDIA